MRTIASLLLCSLLGLGLAGCQIIYKLPTRQGNVIEQKDLDKLALGMTRDQVHFLLGTPVASNAFRDDRWDYIGYYRSPRGEVASRQVTLYFSGDELIRMDGIKRVRNDAAVDGTPSASQVIAEEQREKLEDERKASEQEATGVILQQN